jgi:type II restriction/modification system DNA methylase subunit YeeA
MAAKGSSAYHATWQDTFSFETIAGANLTHGPMPLSLLEFVERWKASTLTERQGAQSHFIDLCDVLDHPHPAAADQKGESFLFEKPVSTPENSKGYADVWKRGYFGWEYKGKHKDLAAAYRQLQRYREDLENPPLLVVCDQERFEVHTNFNTRHQVYSFTLDDLLSSAPTPNCALPPLEVLRALFNDPDLLRPEAASTRVTEQVAADFAKLADSLEWRSIHPERAAHFLMRLLFCLFADSIGLLPDHLFRQMIELDRGSPAKFTRKLRELFTAMSNPGSTWGLHDIHYFNGGLFLPDDEVFELSSADLTVLRSAAALDWSQVEPAIFGTLFERSLNPGKRSQLGAHYTSREDILLIVEPVVIAPLQRRWETVKAEATALAEAANTAKGRDYTKLRAGLQEKLLAWVEELAHIRILDPACGSGNFLYLALRRMLDLWHEARIFSAEHALPTFLDKQVHPSQLFGLETNVYAQELASVVVWIGYLQWLNQNGIGWPVEPILRKLDNIQNRDAILNYDSEGKPAEPEWPEADFIIGNPPFLGGKRLRTELGDTYVNALFAVYEGRVPPEADLVTYWFEKARTMIEETRAKRAGLLATQGIRGGANRIILERIKVSGGIFMAHSDRDWTLDGANVHVSIIGFDDGSQEERELDGSPVAAIHANLTSAAETTSAQALRENVNLCFMGVTRIGAFDLIPKIAQAMLSEPKNPNGRPNSDVVRPWVNAFDITRRPRGMFLIDFGTEMSQADAALYEKPFEYLRQHVYAKRQENSREGYRLRWWIHGEPRPAMRRALAPLHRYIVTPLVSKFRIFAWLPVEVVPENLLNVFAREDDYFFGVLHSHIHEVWGLHMGTALEDRPRYTPTTTFETFPFPWPPGQEPKGSPLVSAIAAAAHELVEKRDAWLNPPGASADELKKRTLTNLYNARPQWLADAHRKLDEAVFAAYGWPHTLTDPELLERLLSLNHQRAGRS